MDGEEATQLIRDFEQKRYPGLRTPIIATTAHAYQEDLDKWSEMGMDGFLMKPISFDRLRILLSHLWKLAHGALAGGQRTLRFEENDAGVF
jgi:CheY-like chemotaxis protein